MSGNIVKWGTYDLEEAQQEQEELDKSGGGQFMKLEQGKNVVRFMPPKVGKRSPFVMVYQHFVQLPGMSAPASFNCPRMAKKGTCPVCQKVEQLRGTGKPADYDLAGQLFPRLRVFANVINRKAPELGPQVLAFGKQVHESLVKLRTDEDTGGDYTHPLEGFDIIIERTGSGKNDTKYAVRAARNQSPLGDLDWIEQQLDLDRYASIPTAEQILEKIQSAPGGGGRTGAAPQGARTSGGGRRPPARTAEDDTEDYDGDE